MRLAVWKRLAAAALAAFLCLAQAGCSFSVLDAQNLMSPPRANLEQQGIYELLQGDGQELTFVYPKRGEHRSAIIMRDWTGDGVEDAIGFVSPEGGGVEVSFLEKGESAWRIAASFSNTATQVDMVLFGDLNGDGREDVLIGWGSASGTTGRTAAVDAYLFDGENVTEYLLGTYGEMTATDFDSDGVIEVFTVDKYLAAEEEGAEDLPALAHLFAWEEGALQELASTAADNSLTNYTSIHFGALDRDLSGVVLDGAKADGSMTTQVFLLEEGTLRNIPSGANAESYQNPYARPSTAPFVSQDINGDGLLELPVVSQLPVLSQGVTLDSTSYLVQWSRFQAQGEPEAVLYALMDLGESYWLELPESLVGKISASNDSARRTVTYTEVVASEDGVQLLGSPLFAIRVFTQSAWDSRGVTSGYEKLAVQGDLVYGIQVFTRDEAYLRAIGQIRQGFHIIAE